MEVVEHQISLLDPCHGHGLDFASWDPGACLCMRARVCCVFVGCSGVAGSVREREMEGEAREIRGETG